MRFKKKNVLLRDINHPVFKKENKCLLVYKKKKNSRALERCGTKLIIIRNQNDIPDYVSPEVFFFQKENETTLHARKERGFGTIIYIYIYNPFNII